VNRRVYVVSKIQHKRVWHRLRQVTNLPIISSWIDDPDEPHIDFTEAWPRYLGEAASATDVIALITPGDVLKGGILEIGAALGAKARLILVGTFPDALRTARHMPSVHWVPDLTTALSLFDAVTIKETAPDLGLRLEGMIGER
jgi:hypothetical protein